MKRPQSEKYAKRFIFVDFIKHEKTPKWKVFKKPHTFAISCKPEVIQKPSQAKSEQNAKYIHQFCKKVSQIAHTFENLKFWTKKVSQIDETFENLKSDPLFRRDEMKVTCRKCDRGVRKWLTGLRCTPPGPRQDLYSVNTVWGKIQSSNLNFGITGMPAA